MTGVLGHSAVLLGLLASSGGFVFLVAGLLQKRTDLIRASWSWIWGVAIGAVGAFAAMEVALLRHDFSLQYVADNGSRSTPLLYTIASAWSALEGSILLWILVLTGFLVALALRHRAQRSDPVFGWALAVMFIVATFFFFLALGPADPFNAVRGAIPSDGPGPNPLLQNHPLMALHPPILYTGYVGFTVPFAFAIASLVTGRVDEGWVLAMRRWSLVAFGFLTTGIMLGAWWSYEVLGWGGFWAWDPVENASFLPWLTASAYLHSALVQERRGMLRVWNLSLVTSTFALTILGTFLTRSGVLDSVHSFTESNVGPLLLGFFALIVFSVCGLLAWRGDALRAPGSIDSPVSREAAFLLNNLLFAAFAFVVLLGTVFPLVAESVNGTRLSIGRPYFDRMTGPIGIALLFLMAVAPALPWRKASHGVLRQRLLVPAWLGGVTLVALVALGMRNIAALLAFSLGAFAGGAALRQLVLAARAARRNGASWLRGISGRANGGMVVHFGVVVVAVGFAASSSFVARDEFRLEPGESARLAGHTVTYLGSKTIKHSNRTSVEASVRVDNKQVYKPALSTYPFATQAIGTPSVRGGPLDDVYLTLVAPATSRRASAVVGVVVTPLVNWLWAGGGIMALGTALALVPGRRRLPTAPASASTSAVAIEPETEVVPV
ncbi:MAG TPA: heme lyase CcmF/NrfE family subunit [Acidimicrobiales bacterium]|nr:heme lyase CcmF/NrfE family subunit [Acidimicrobiales bacterium]